MLSSRRIDTPADDADNDAWNEWKASVVTESQAEFVRRNPWFSFRKDDIAKNLGGKLAVPAVFWSNRGVAGKSITEAFAEIGRDPKVMRTFVVKELRGHSSKEVKPLVYDDRFDAFYDGIGKKYLSLADMDAEMTGKEFLIEQSLYTVREPIPLDFKVYCGEGRVRAILVIDRNHGKPILTYIDPVSWERMTWKQVFRWATFKSWAEGDEPTPDVIERAKAAAVFAEDAIGTVNAKDLFLSFDLFVLAPDDIYLGEITPRPGAVHANKLTIDFIRRCLV